MRRRQFIGLVGGAAPPLQPAPFSAQFDGATNVPEYGPVKPKLAVPPGATTAFQPASVTV